MFYLKILKDKYKVSYICGTPKGENHYRIQLNLKNLQEDTHTCTNEWFDSFWDEKRIISYNFKPIIIIDCYKNYFNDRFRTVYKCNDIANHCKSNIVISY